MNDPNTPDTPDATLEERIEIDRQLGVPEDALRNVAEDQETIGPRKPSSDAVELERIRRAQEE